MLTAVMVCWERIVDSRTSRVKRAKTSSALAVEKELNEVVVDRCIRQSTILDDAGVPNENSVCVAKSPPSSRQLSCLSLFIYPQTCTS